jgi:hypothetical protein
MDMTVMPIGRLSETIQVKVVIAICIKGGLPIVTTLYDMLRNTPRGGIGVAGASEVPFPMRYLRFIILNQWKIEKIESDPISFISSTQFLFHTYQAEFLLLKHKTNSLMNAKTTTALNTISPHRK